MPIFYNSLTKNKHALTPINPDNIGMYVCGPTVYDYAHIGNARPVIVFDTVFRLLNHIYGEGKVTYVRNVTDVDDKINQRALEEKRTIREITTETLAQYHQDIEDLGTLPPTFEPRATDYIGQMIAMIDRLVESGHAYEAEGHVLFSVHNFKNYGLLSNRSLDDMLAGARVEVAPYKRDPMDFVLWKPSDKMTPGWDSPWGYGRPGWHIECSAMSSALLGEKFDIHGGGVDLMFPHHENEIAQSCACHGNDQMASIWMHNGFVQVEGEKMSKSLGNFLTIRELLDEWDGEVLRLAMLMTHYRQPINWTKDLVREAETTLKKWRTFLQDQQSSSDIPPDEEFLKALKDDVNTPKAIARLHILFKTAKTDPEIASIFTASAQILGLLLPENKISQGYRKAVKPKTSMMNNSLDAEIQALILERNEARKTKNFSRSDEIRDMLADKGIKLIDGPNGTTWEKQ